MFESYKIISKCNQFLKQFHIELSPEYHFYKKHGLIHCKVNDWRGPAEVDGFPVLTCEAAVRILLVSSLFEYFLKEELKFRTELRKNYPLGCGAYDSRKYGFEKTLKAIRQYNESFYYQQISIFEKQFNKNRKTKFKWHYDTTTEKFITKKVTDLIAININKMNSSVLIYNQDPCGGKPLDNFYRYLETIEKEDCTQFCFENDDEQFYLDVYHPEAVEETEETIGIGFAEKMIWSRKNYDISRVFVVEDNRLEIKECKKTEVITA